MTAAVAQTSTIAFQGELGAYSHLSCQQAFPDYEVVPCKTFDDAFEAVKERRVDYAMIPIENNLGGRVAEVHHLMRLSNLQIVREHFLPVNHHLLGVPGATLADIKVVHSHEQALDQSRAFIKAQGLQRRVYVDTAGAAKYVSELGDKSVAAIASSMAGQIYGLETLRESTQDAQTNTTRFVVLGREREIDDSIADQACVTSLLFRLSSVPAALYKALGGFATNGVNMLKLESYIADSQFTQAEFYAEVAGHVSDEAVQRSLDELQFFTSESRIVGVYPMHDFRLSHHQK